MKNLRLYSLPQLEALMEAWGEKRSRAAAIYSSLWEHYAATIAELSPLPETLKQRLAEQFYIRRVQDDYFQYSDDGTIKSRMKLEEGYFIEGVLIPAEKRITACLSSQVGCSLSCRFCATGYMERKRNIGFDEIVDELVLLNEQSMQQYGKPVSNVVFMGMGEPLLNYKNVTEAIARITMPKGLAIAPKRVTISTAGVAKMIRQLADDGLRVNLALSLHAANDSKRNEIMPINETNNLEALVSALNYFYEKTRNEITFEYILFRDFNDSLEDADELVRIFRSVPAHLVNILEYNPISQADYSKPDDGTIRNFTNYLNANKVNAHLRRSRGKDIDAACGQLANVRT
jgi:23S rRNA (adenine2503-C2)-methyltransferase